MTNSKQEELREDVLKILLEEYGEDCNFDAQMRLTGLINSEALSLLEELEKSAVVPVHSPHNVKYVSLSAIQTLKERHKP